jgi:hypothetical protein
MILLFRSGDARLSPSLSAGRRDRVRASIARVH